MNRYFIILGIILCLPICLNAQENIGGIVNSYYKVTSVSSGSNYVTCDAAEDLSSLHPGDKVLLIQMTGAYFSTSGSWFLNDIPAYAWNNTGAYEFLAVNNVSGQNVYFTANLKRTYASSEKYQLVKVHETETATVTSTLQATPWNGDKGGILAIVALKKLILNADIDVSGDGFRGAQPVDYTAGCRPVFAADTFYFDSTYLNRGGRKGENMITTAVSYPIGMGSMCNGGGGGAGLYGSGGGGSNYGTGGVGFPQGNSCPYDGSLSARGGKALGQAAGGSFYANGNNYFSMGGGGGSSTQTITYSASAGGNGGGVVFIMADTIVGNNHTIIANGNSALAAQAGGSGGGGGGTVILAVTGYSSDLNISAHGGKGGNAGLSCGGGGGGGGGGILWYSGSSVSSLVHPDLAYGTGGSVSCGPFLGSQGVVGGSLNGLVPVLNGFSFNAINKNDTICNGQTPKQIIGSTPKGTGPYTFQWLQSPDNSTWAAIASSNTKNYSPGALSSTTYYTRVVTDQSNGVKDTAFSVEILVYPSIAGNVLTLRDTICSGVKPGLLTANTVSGGDNSSYSYTWQSKTSSSSWANRGTSVLLTESNSLTNSTFYRRIVVSAKVCTDTSLTDTITVIPVISNNTIVPVDTTICYGLQAGSLASSASISGGDGQYSYSWLVSSDNTIFSSIGGATNSSYNPGTLTAPRYYKRIVFSGNGNACIDTTSASAIHVLPSITDNTISSASALFCYNTVPEIISGQQPGGGTTGDYRYQWLSSTGSQYSAVAGATSKDYQPPALTTSTYYRRQVISGADNACIDTSTPLMIDIVPDIINNLASTDENICENDIPQPFSEGAASGGAGGFKYKWIQKTTISEWSGAYGVDTTISYSPPQLNSTTTYSRVAYSSICSDTSTNIIITVYPKIIQNSILGAANQYVCYNVEKNLSGSNPSGGNNTYAYNWQLSSDATSWSSASGTNLNFTSGKLISPTYFRRIVESGELSQCKDTSDAVLVNINPLPIGDIITATDTLCADNNIDIDYNFTGNRPWKASLGGGAQSLASFDNINDAGGTFTFSLSASANIVLLSLEDDSTCLADLSSNTGLVTAKVYENPIANAGTDFSVCGLTAQLNAIPSVGTGTWQIDAGTFDNNTSPAAKVTSDSYGTFLLTWTEANWQCSDSKDIQVTFYELPDSVSAGTDLTITNYDTTLDALPPNVGEGVWIQTGGAMAATFADSALYNTKVELEGEGDYVLMWSVTNGTCPAVSDSINLIVQPTMIYQGFSPDGDGINDNFIIDFADGKSAKLDIYDRNGQLVNSLKGFDKIEWDGTSKNGNPLPQDTYYYIFTRDDHSVKPKKGFIELRRSHK